MSQPVTQSVFTAGEAPGGASLNPEKMPGHWVLARMGKRVLRPGGLGMTRRMLADLKITADDEVVEFAPGLGVTARMMLSSCHPAAYTAVERDEGAANLVRRWLDPANPRQQVITGSAQHTGLPDACATVVYGEAMLSMHVDSTKRAIIREAFRLLRPGGRYGIHELSLTPEDLSADQAQAVCHDVTQGIRHQAVPLKIRLWREVLNAEGFEVINSFTASMALLEPGRLIRDEGLAGAVRIMWNMARDSTARKRIKAMRRVFRTHRDHLGAVCLIARKP